MKNNISENEQFFSKVSHDLRGSFTSILGFSDILNDPCEKLDGAEISEFAARISKQSQDTFELLVNFVNWLKLENYNYGLNIEKIELNDVLFEEKAQHQKKLTEKNVTINIDVDSSAVVLMDYEILNLIISNIFVFIIKTCCKNSRINVSSTSGESKYTSLEISASCDNNETSFLQNIDIKDLKNELSFPIIFAVKFTEQSGGKFKFSVDQENNLNIILNLPKN